MPSDFARGRLVVLVLAQRLDEEPALELVHHLLERALRRLHALDHALDLADARREQVGRDEAAGVDLDDEALHLVLQLAHVARASRSPGGAPSPAARSPPAGLPSSVE